MCENTRAGRIPAGRSLDTRSGQAKRRVRSDVKPVGFPVCGPGNGVNREPGFRWNLEFTADRA